MYGPFGELIRATGPMAKANPFRFSTKYQDDESDLLYYGYRYLNASTGRFLSRDPINEPGFEMETARPKSSRKDLTEFMLAALDMFRKFLKDSPSAAVIENTDITHAGDTYIFALNDSILLYDPLGLDCPKCDSGIGQHSLPINSPCGLRACAQHDQCYDQNKCSASSWLSTIAKMEELSHGLSPTFSPCDFCNMAVLAALNDCLHGKSSSGPMYYCAKQHRFISIPGDFPTVTAAKCACCN
jgi:RHS repeat-associated protein